MPSPGHHLRIVVADDDPPTRVALPQLLSSLGHEVVAVAGTGRELAEHCRARHPDLVITDIQMPDMDGIQAAAQIGREAPVPVVLVSGHDDEELIERAASCPQVLTYLIKLVDPRELRAAIALAVRRAQQFVALARRADALQRALEERKLIERAKGVVMRRAGLSEPDAHRRLQRLASTRNQKLVEVARTVLAADEALRPPPGRG